MKTRKMIFKTYTSLLLALLISFSAKSQKLRGVVVNSETEEPLSFVHIGVVGKNVGLISDDEGQFELDLSKFDKDDDIVFSMISYETLVIARPESHQRDLVIKLKPIFYEMEMVEIAADRKIKSTRLGRYRSTKTTTGEGGTEEFGFGGEWGIRIVFPGKSYYLKDINFHTRFNTVDSVLYRLNVYEIDDGLPGRSKLGQEIYTRSYSGDKWISANIVSHGIKIDKDVIVTFELVRIWYNPVGTNQLFYSHGKGYEEGSSYSRESSHDRWMKNERGPIAMYVTAMLDD